MAEIFVSAGVYSQEIDESFIPAGAAAIGAALVGLTQKGPAFLPTRVNSFGEFRESFGNMDPSLTVPYAARSYLRNGTSLNVVRVLGRSTASVGNAVHIAFPLANQNSGAVLSSSNVAIAQLRFRGSLQEVYLSGSPTNFAIAIPGKGVTANGLSVVESSGAYIKKVLGTDPTVVKAGDSLTALYVESVFDWYAGTVLGSVSGAEANSNFVSATGLYSNITGGFSGASSPMIVSQNYGGSVYDLFQVYSLGHGDAENDNIKISITQVNTSTTGFPSFTVVVRDIDDTDLNPVILESFINVNLDATSKNYIARVIGDRRPTYDLTQTPPEILFNGDYNNNSKYIRVIVQDGFPINARPSGFKGIGKIQPVAATAAFIPSLPLKTSELNSRNELDSTVFMGVDFTQGGVKDRLKKGITSASGTTTADSGVLFFSTTGDLAGSGNVTAYSLVNMVGSSSGNYNSTNSLRFTVPMYDGFDGIDPRVNKYTAMNDGTLSGDFDVAIKTLSNADEIDFNLIAVPGVHSSSVGSIPSRVIDMITQRGDAFYILDISPGSTTAAALSASVAQAIVEAQKYDSSYAATYYPWIRINDVDNDQLVWVPPSVEVIGAYSFNDKVAQPWWAIAGFNRAGMENVIEARRRLTQGQRDDLYSVGNVNPIATFPGGGIVIWGQKTLQKKDSALDRISVRRMLLTVRKTIAGFSRIFVFEPNTPTTRSKLLNLINSYLSQVRDSNGLTEFRAVLDETTTTQDLIDRNIMKGKIYLRPTNAAEIIMLDYSLSNRGLTITD